jgi:hypothetical protein
VHPLGTEIPVPASQEHCGCEDILLLVGQSSLGGLGRKMPDVLRRLELEEHRFQALNS